jgi:transposase
VQCKGQVFVFRSRRGTAIRILVYDGQGFWLAQKRLSKGRFRWWPEGRNAREVTRSLAAHQLQVLLAAGDPTATQAAPAWRPGERDELRKKARDSYVLISTLLRSGAWKESFTIGAEWLPPRK